MRFTRSCFGGGGGCGGGSRLLVSWFKKQFSEMNYRASLSFIVLSVICVLTVILWWYSLRQFKYTKIETPEDMAKFLNEHIKRTNKATFAFTYKYHAKEKLYENYHVDKLGKLERRMEPYPVNSLGEEICTTASAASSSSSSSASSSKGAVYDVTESGFRVTGVDSEFKCPAGWHWNDTKKMCIVQSLCESSDPTGTIKGLLVPDGKVATTKYHEREYAICKPSTKGAVEVEFDHCPENKVYNQRAVNPAGTDPCEYYDVCAHKDDMYLHKYKISKDSTLAKDEYYMCHGGRSVVKKCTDGHVFSTNLNSCTEYNKCLDLPNGATIKLSDTAYISCVAGKEKVIECPHGLYTAPGGGGAYECVNEDCHSLIAANPVYRVRLVEVRNLGHFAYMYKAEKCVNNKVISLWVGKAKPRQLVLFSNRAESKYYSRLTNRISEKITWPTKIIARDGTVLQFEKFKDLVTHLDDLPERTPVRVQYNDILPVMYYDVALLRPSTFAVKTWNRVAAALTERPSETESYDIRHSLVDEHYMSKSKPSESVPLKAAMSFYSTNRPYFFKHQTDGLVDDELVEKAYTEDGHVLWAIFRRERARLKSTLPTIDLSKYMDVKFGAATKSGGATAATPLTPVETMTGLDKLVTVVSDDSATSDSAASVLRLVEGLPYNAKWTEVAAPDDETRKIKVLEFSVNMFDKLMHVKLPMSDDKEAAKYNTSSIIVRPNGMKPIVYDESKFDYDKYKYFIVTNIMYTEGNFAEHVFETEELPCVSFYLSLCNEMNLYKITKEVLDFNYSSFFSAVY